MQFNQPLRQFRPYKEFSLATTLPCEASVHTRLLRNTDLSLGTRKCGAVVETCKVWTRCSPKWLLRDSLKCLSAIITHEQESMNIHAKICIARMASAQPMNRHLHTPSCVLPHDGGGVIDGPKQHGATAGTVGPFPSLLLQTDFQLKDADFGLVPNSSYAIAVLGRTFLSWQGISYNPVM